MSVTIMTVEIRPVRLPDAASFNATGAMIDVVPELIASVLSAACGLAFLLATAVKWLGRRQMTSGGYEADLASSMTAQGWDVLRDVIQKLSAVIGILTVVLEHAFGLDV